MQDLKVTLIQSDLVWHNPEKNLDHFEHLIDSINEPTDLIVLPEMFTTGFTMHPHDVAEKLNGRTPEWMLEMAVKKNSVVAGSYIAEDNGKFLNRLVVMYPDGSNYHYDKRHLFRMAEENKYFTPGNKHLIFNVKGWKISAFICYDLRFPVWSRNTYNNGEFAYDCMINVASWPEVRNYIWQALLIARAIENQSYIVGVNRIGSDGNGIPHSGDSMVVDPLGKPLKQLEPHKELVETLTISAEKLINFRNKVNYGLDWEKFKIL